MLFYQVFIWLKLPLPFLWMRASVERYVTLWNLSNTLENPERSDYFQATPGVGTLCIATQISTATGYPKLSSWSISGHVL